MTGAVNARSKRQQEKWRFESAVANESTDLPLTLGDSDDAEKETAASTITKVVSWNDAGVSTFGDYAKTATVKLLASLRCILASFLSAFLSAPHGSKNVPSESVQKRTHPMSMPTLSQACLGGSISYSVWMETCHPSACRETVTFLALP